MRNHPAMRLIALLLHDVFEFNLVPSDASFANHLFDTATTRIAHLEEKRPSHTVPEGRSA